MIVRIDLKPVDVFNSLMRGQKKSSLHFVNPYYTIGSGEDPTFYLHNNIEQHTGHSLVGQDNTRVKPYNLDTILTFYFDLFATCRHSSFTIYRLMHLKRVECIHNINKLKNKLFSNNRIKVHHRYTIHTMRCCLLYKCAFMFETAKRVCQSLIKRERPYINLSLDIMDMNNTWVNEVST
ncbi:hypothetical protein AGLY_006216 [Aphis glycines]|uniref:Uncharacterized protein n=1 Tax=Aphis glycines TaxID=307491 RepID=A0A6G0TQL7_APHGL|nr:hypothetical protein AGLY_006216 [Aphis glycines]